MRTVYHTLRWKNFLSTGNQWSEVRLDKSHTTGIFGSNGAGKSTMIDAFMYVLFNKPFRKFSIPDLLNSITGRDMEAQVEFSVNNKRYKVVRGFKPKVFEIYQDGELLNQDSAARDYQKFLEDQILKSNYKTMTQTCIIGKASYIPFMELPTGNKREVIEDLLDLKVFSTMNTLLKQKIANNIADLKDSQKEQQTLQVQLELLRERAREIQIDTETLVSEKKSQIDAHLIEMARLTGETEEKTIRVANILASGDPTDKKNKLNDRINAAALTLAKLGAKKRQLVEHLTFFGSHDDCPTCKQSIDQTFKDDTTTKTNEKIVVIEQAIFDLQQQHTLMVAEYNELSLVVRQLDTLNNALSALENHRGWVNRAMKQLEDEIVNILKTVEAKADNRIPEFEAQLNELSLKISQLTFDREVYSISAAILKDDGLKAKTIKKYIPVINQLINKYLASMDFFVNFELDEQFEETIKSRHRDKFRYHSFSEGEKVRINLAILFAWRSIAKIRSSSNVNLLIIDEVMDGSLDHSGTEDFLKLIKSLPEDTNTFVVSHKTDQVEGRFNRSLRLVKTKNFSRIFEE